MIRRVRTARRSSKSFLVKKLLHHSRALLRQPLGEGCDPSPAFFPNPTAPIIWNHPPHPAAMLWVERVEDVVPAISILGPGSQRGAQSPSSNSHDVSALGCGALTGKLQSMKPAFEIQPATREHSYLSLLLRSVRRKFSRSSVLFYSFL